MDTLRDMLSNTKLPAIAWLGPKSFFVVDHPEDIQIVMNSRGCLEKSDMFRFFSRGIGLFVAPGLSFFF